MVDHHTIYRSRASDYDRLVSREDCQGLIGPALARIRSMDGLEIVELGAGTGRLTRLLAPVASRILVTDISAHMLEMAGARLRAGGFSNWSAVVADNRSLPVTDRSTDLALAGWTLGHMVGWFKESWPEQIGRAVAEMVRVLKPGGTAIILETLGTGREEPRPPTAGLSAYYALLERDLGFSSTWIRTDYRFHSLDEGAWLIRFFFGPDMEATFLARKSLSFPECTGIWWRRR